MGQYFYVDDEDIGFRYTAEDADILVRNDLYHFDQAPISDGNTLEWHQGFDDRDIAVTVNCPLPAPSPSEVTLAPPSAEPGPSVTPSLATPAPAPT